MKFIFAFIGKKGAGKTTAASHIKSLYPEETEHLSFAAPIRDMLKVLIPHEHLMRVTEKETSIEELEGKSFRHAAQTLGTEWGRKLVGKDLWTNHLIRTIANTPDKHIIIDDLRFMNEFEELNSMGGYTLICIKVSRESLGVSIDEHVSEVAWTNIRPNYIVYNDGALDELLSNIKKVVDGKI